MGKSINKEIEATFEKIVGGGQALATDTDGRKIFAWGILPGETGLINITKKKSKYLEGVAVDITALSSQRVEPRDKDSYLSTSPWQIMSYDSELHYKSALIEEAFELHDIVLPSPIEVYSDGIQYNYRNKVEFSWYGDSQTNEAGETVETLDLAFFRRGSKGKIKVDGTSLANENINILARAVRDLLRGRVDGRQLKTLLIRCDRNGKCVWQLYVKDEGLADLISPAEAANLPALGGEIIFSDPRSPASRITKRLAKFGEIILTDKILNTSFSYATEGFFQVNLSVYETALKDIEQYLTEVTNKDTFSGNVLDLYSGVGTIGLTVGLSAKSNRPAETNKLTLVEINEDAVREMRRNISSLSAPAEAVLAPSEKALDYITKDNIVIVDPPRAGLHAHVIEKLLSERPGRIIYLSCNPVTQARDVALLANAYGTRAHRGYNFFPRTPHIEHLVVLDLY